MVPELACMLVPDKVEVKAERFASRVVNPEFDAVSQCWASGLRPSNLHRIAGFVKRHSRLQPLLGNAERAFGNWSAIDARDEERREDHDAETLGNGLDPGRPYFVAHAVILAAERDLSRQKRDDNAWEAEDERLKWKHEKSQNHSHSTVTRTHVVEITKGDERDER
jgi:hypothetical protein